MNRFVAIIWNKRADHAASDAAALVASVERNRPHWKRLSDKPGFIVFEGERQGAGDDSLQAGDDALFVGPVFEGNGRKAASIDVARLRATAGAAAFTQVWGRYVAFVCDEDEACVHV